MLSPFHKETPTKIKNMSAMPFDLVNTFLGIAIIAMEASVSEDVYARCPFQDWIMWQNKTSITTLETKWMSTHRGLANILWYI